MPDGNQRSLRTSLVLDAKHARDMAIGALFAKVNVLDANVMANQCDV